MAKRKNLYKYVHEIQEWDFATNNILNVIVEQLIKLNEEKELVEIKILISDLKDKYSKFLPIRDCVSKYIKYPCFNVDKLKQTWDNAWKGVCNVAYKNPTCPKYDEAIGILEEGVSFGIVDNEEKLKDEFTEKWQKHRNKREQNYTHPIPEETKFN